MNKVKRFFISGGILLIALSLCIVAAEGIVRLTMPDTVKFRLMNVPDQKLGYRLAPEYRMTYRTSEFDTDITINSEGLRDHEYPAGKDRETVRILALGDSFTFGSGVNIDETYSKVLEVMLNADAGHEKGRRYEVINAGIFAFGTEQEYLYLEELLKRYNPDLVMVGLHSNDVSDVMRGIHAPAMVASRRSYFVEYVRGLQILMRSALKRDREKIELFDIYRDRYSPQFETALEETKDYLLKIRGLSASTGARTLIVIIPSCLEVDKTQWQKKGFGRLYTDEFFSRNMLKFSDIFVEFGRLQHVPTIPLLPVMRNSVLHTLYFDRDAHWTREGHRLAAETIYSYMKENDIFVK